jgi:hypothetical protein
MKTYIYPKNFPKPILDNTLLLLAKVSLVAILLFLGFGKAFSQTTDSYTNTGSWICPAGVTSITVECWGGGGAGGGATGNPAAGGGGAGGSYALKVITVVPGNTYTVTIGAAGVGSTGAGGAGGDTWFNTTATIIAKGGAGGAVATVNSTNGAGGTGSSVGCIGDLVYAGGNGSIGNYTSGTPGGAGGSGAGSTGAGNNAVTGTGGAAKNLNGGPGANGVANSTAGSNGSIYGGAGSGGKANSTTDRAGGNGAKGYITITYCLPLSISSQPSNASICAGNNITFSIIASGSPTITYKWQRDPNTGTFADITSGGMDAGVTYSSWNTATLNLTGATTSVTNYRYRCVVSVVGCGQSVTSNTANLTVNTAPADPGAISSNSPQCAGTGVTFTMGACPSGAGTCYWQTTANGTSTANSNPTYTTNTTAGVYIMYIRSYNGICWSNAVSSTGIVNTAPYAYASSNSPICENGTLTLTGGPAYMTSYQWSGPVGYSSSTQNPTVTSNATVAMTGTYTITITNSEGCTATASTPVTVNAALNSCATTPIPANAATGVSLAQILSWSSVSGATNYDVYFGTSPTPSFYINVNTTSFSPILNINTTYYWYVIPKNSSCSSSGCSGTVWSFTTTNSCGGNAYKSNATGNWTTIANWLVSIGGGAWNPAAAYPTSANACSVEICNGHTITVDANITAPNTVVDAGGILTDVNFIITYGIGYSLINNGTLSCSAGGTSITSWDGKGIYIDGATLINNGTITVNATGVISISNTNAGSKVINYGTINNSGGGYYWDGVSATTNYYGGFNASASKASIFTNYNIINNIGVNLTAAGNYRSYLELNNCYNYALYNNTFKRANTDISGEFANYSNATLNNSGNVGVNGTGPATNAGTYNENWCTTLDNGVVFTNTAGATFTLGIDGCLRALANKANGVLYAQVINNGIIINGNMWTPSNVDGLITSTQSGRITSYINNNIIIDNGPIKNGGTFTNTTNSQFIYQETTGSISGNNLKYQGNAILNYNGSIPQTTSNYEFPLSISDSPSYVEIDNSSGVANGVTLHAARTINYNTGNPPSNGVPYLILSNGALKLNGYTLTINSSSKTAIARDGTTQTGYIVSEQNAATNNSIIAWNCGVTSGNFIYPFGADDGTYIPVTFNKITSSSSNISISTRTTLINDNTPWATGVADMNCIEGVNSSITTVIDRWWNITPSAAVTADVSYTYRGSENTTTGSNPKLAMQRWDAGGSFWNDGNGGSAGTFNNTGSNVISGPGVAAVKAVGLTQFSNIILLLEGGSMPVELVLFNVECKDSKTKIVWATASETNNDYFTIEKSADATQFENLATITGAGNSNSYISYSYTDDNPYSGITYYRIKQTDFDGTSTSSAIINSSCKNSEDQIALNLSFANGEVYMTVSHLIDDYSLSIFDAAGKLVYNDDIKKNSEQTQQFILNGDLFNPGLYFIQLLSKDNSLIQKFIIK